MKNIFKEVLKEALTESVMEIINDIDNGEYDIMDYECTCGNKEIYVNDKFCGKCGKKTAITSAKAIADEQP